VAIPITLSVSKKKDMRKIVMILFVSTISFVCQAQIDTIIKKDTSIRILKPYSFKDIKNNPLSFSNYTDNLKKISSPFDLYHDSLYIREAYYNSLLPNDNKMLFIYDKHFFYFNNPLQPYGYGGGIGKALGFGALNYLILLFDKK